MKNNNIFLKVGKPSVEGVFKMFKGIAAFNIIAVNPNKKELEEITGREIQEEPTYVGQTEDGKTYIRLSFYAKTNLDSKVNNGINLHVPINFTLVKENRVGSNSGKCQIIDKFGRTAWATPEEVESKSIPVYSSGPANISPDYRLAYNGEEYFINFLINWLNIPAPAIYKDKTWILKDNTEESEVLLDMEALFKGNVSELKSILNLVTAYTVKGAVGIKTVETDNGTRQYQTVFNRQFAKNSITDYSRIEAAIVDFQNNNGAPNTEFSVLPLHENVVEATNFEKDNDPLGAGSAPSTTPWG